MIALPDRTDAYAWANAETPLPAASGYILENMLQEQAPDEFLLKPAVKTISEQRKLYNRY